LRPPCSVHSYQQSVSPLGPRLPRSSFDAWSASAWPLAAALLVTHTRLDTRRKKSSIYLHEIDHIRRKKSSMFVIYTCSYRMCAYMNRPDPHTPRQTMEEEKSSIRNYMHMCSYRRCTSRSSFPACMYPACRVKGLTRTRGRSRQPCS